MTDMNRFVLSVFCALVLCLSACSRQQSDWQKTREVNTTDSYEQFIKKYPSGEFTAQAQARAKELYEERDWQKARDTDSVEAYQAFIKQYPEGKWTEEARIRVENFTLAQAPAPTKTPAAGGDAAATAAPPDVVHTPPASPTTAPPIKAAVPAAHAAMSAAAASTASALPSSKSHGGYGVQLGAYKTGTAAAKQRWVRLQKQYPKLLSGLTSKVVTKKTAAGSVYRLQAVGLTEKHARAICSGLKAKAQPCLLVLPDKG